MEIVMSFVFLSAVWICFSLGQEMLAVENFMGVIKSVEDEGEWGSVEPGDNARRCFPHKNAE